jgi:hypothetical protein
MDLVIGFETPNSGEIAQSTMCNYKLAQTEGNVFLCTVVDIVRLFVDSQGQYILSLLEARNTCKLPLQAHISDKRKPVWQAEK